MTKILDLGVFAEVNTGHRYTAHSVRESSCNPSAGNVVLRDSIIITVPEIYPYPCFAKDLFLGMWPVDQFNQKFTRTTSKP